MVSTAKRKQRAGCDSRGCRRERKKDTVWYECSWPIYFIPFYQPHSLSSPNEYFIVICFFICMLYNLGLCNHNHGRDCTSPLFDTCSAHFEVSLGLMQGGETSLATRKLLQTCCIKNGFASWLLIWHWMKNVPLCFSLRSEAMFVYVTLTVMTH